MKHPHQAVLERSNTFEYENKLVTSDTSFKIIDEVTDFKSVANFWKNEQWHPYTDIEYYTNVIVNEPNFLKPFILVIYKNNRPETLVIGSIVKDKFSLQIGYKKLFKVKTKRLVILYGGILGNQSVENCTKIISILRSQVSKRKVNSIRFKYIDSEFTIFKVIKSSNRILLKDSVIRKNPHYFLSFPGCLETFLKSRTKKTRRNIKYYISRIEKAYGDSLTVKCLKDISDYDTIINDTDSISSHTYQRKLGVGMIANEQTKERIKYELQHGRFMSYILYIKGQPVAYWNGLYYKHKVYGVATGYLPEFSKVDPGKYIFVTMINDFCKNKDIDIMDFGFGEAQYKKEYSTSEKLEANFHIYAINPKGFYLCYGRAFNTILVLLYSKLKDRIKFLNDIKKKWRLKLSAA